MNKRTTRGNVIFLILIAVALFAALGFAVSRNSGGSNNMDRNKADLAANDIMGYATALQRNIEQMRTVDKVSETDLDPGYTVTLASGSTTSNYNGNSNCTTNTCRVFIDKGGNFQVKSFTQYAPNRPSSWLTTTAAMGTIDFVMVDVNGVGTAAPEIAMRVIGLKTDVCNAVHRRMGLTENTNAIESGSAIAFYSASALNELNGSATSSPNVGFSNTVFKNKTTFCEFNTTDKYANFYAVVLAR